jgi:hypothetical protein
MSNQLNHTTKTLPEHHNGEALPGGSGNCACEGSVLNSFLLDYVVKYVLEEFGFKSYLCRVFICNESRKSFSSK